MILKLQIYEHMCKFNLHNISCGKRLGIVIDFIINIKFVQ